MREKRKKGVNTKVVENIFLWYVFLTAIPIAIGSKGFFCEILIIKNKVRKALPLLLCELY